MRYPRKLLAVTAGLWLLVGLADQPGTQAAAPSLSAVARAAQTAQCLPGWVSQPSPNLPSQDDFLMGIAASASTDVWTVGDGLATALAEHWDGSTWITTTLPISGTGITVQAVATRGATDAWLVGAYYNGGQMGFTLTEHWNGSAWSVVPSPSGPVDNMLYGVAIVAANDVWAVGGGGMPLLLHWNGTTWTAMAAPGLSGGARLYGVAAHAADDVWAVSGDSILHWNGSAWSQVFSPTSGVTAVTTLAANDAWAVGTATSSGGGMLQTLVEHWDGTAWTVVPSPSIGSYSRLRGVTAVAANDVWAVGSSGDTPNLRTLALHWDGTAWTVVATPNQGANNNELYAVAAVSAAEVWAAGLPRVQLWDGTSWQLAPNPAGPTDNLLLGLAALTAQDIWSVGSSLHSALFVHGDGTSFSSVPGADLGQGYGRPAGVAVVATDDVWAVGSVIIPNVPGPQTLAEHWNGQVWTLVPSPNVNPDTNSLAAVAAWAAGDVWAVGSYYDPNGQATRTLVLHWDGTAWRLVASPNGTGDANWLAGVAAVAANDAWAVGATGTSGGSTQSLIAHWNGTTWTPVAAPAVGVASSLTAVSARAANDIWAVGSTTVGGVPQTLVLHWDGTAWAVSPSPNSGSGANSLRAVSARAADDVWAVGDVDGRSGLALHWDGRVWNVVSTGRLGVAALYGVVALAADSAWAAGANTTNPSLRRTLVAHWAPGTVPYTDIAGNPFYDYITSLYCRNVVDGYPDNTFRPYADATRGTLAHWVVTARAWPIDTSGGPHFSDVPTSDPLYSAIETAYHHGMISGYADGTFRPANPLTRGQMSKMIALGWGWAPDTSGGPHFRDVDAANPFYAPIETLYHHGLVSGYSCSGGPEPCPGFYFRWGANNTRGQLTKVLATALGP
ncbi:MAG TPA: S-layer homology domain-containing protein [Chloroflexia bacterium]|nr:S-layer homology domain-containing protein [Chloroflexia bacterium]